MNHTSHSYSPGHPWFYVLGGPVQMPSAIRARVHERGYRGYRSDDIANANRKAEPMRSAALRQLKAEVSDQLRRDLRRYREAARALRAWRREHGTSVANQCDGVHEAISLKYNHLSNHFAHLIWLDELLAHQEQLALL